MKTARILLYMTLWMGMSLSTFAQSNSRGPMSTSSIGHMSVTLLSPAALTSTQDLAFNDISIKSIEASIAVADNDISMASVRVSGTQATFSVTVSNKDLGFSQNGRTLSISKFSSVSSIEKTGISNIHIGATLRISNEKASKVEKTISPLAVIINYN